MLVSLDVTQKHLNPTLSFNCFSANSNCCWSCWYFCVALPWKTMSSRVTWLLVEKSSSSRFQHLQHPSTKRVHIFPFGKGVSSSSQLWDWGFQKMEKKNIHHSKSQPNPLSPQAKDQPVVHESEAMDPSRFPRCSSGSSAATRYGAGGFTSPIRNQRGKSLDLVFGWWIVVGLWFTYSILNYTLGIFFGRLDEVGVLWSCGEFIQNLRWKYQSDFICQVGDGCSFLTLECQEFG